LAVSDEPLLVPGFWLNEACNVLWLQVQKMMFTADEAREGLDLLRAQVEPTPTAGLGCMTSLSRSASPSIILMRTHPDPVMTRMLLPRDWAAAGGIGG
jgi:hypothetical protein